MQFAQRLANFKTNVFADMGKAKTRATAMGKQVIDLSLGSSDLPVEPHIIRAIAESLEDPSTYGYLLHDGTRKFREAVAKWYTNSYGVSVDPQSEVLTLIGSQEGTAHLPLVVLNPGDYALLLDPGYPSHSGGVYLANGKIHPLILRACNSFLPDFSEIPLSVLQQAKLMILSYPHNPTTATATKGFFEEALDFCDKWNIVLAHDFPYMDMVYEGIEKPPSILQIDREKRRSIEFFTFSKSYNMGGLRIGFAIGNSKLIEGLSQVKAAIDFNQYLGIINGAIVALNSPSENIKKTVNIFEQRRDRLLNTLSDYNWQIPSPISTMYVWAKIPEKISLSSLEFCLQLVESTGVALSPGSGFGQAGEGYVRFALVKDGDTLELAAHKIASFLAGLI